MADLDTNWTYNFSGLTSSSKAQSRPSLPKETAWDLIGFDGNHVGGLRPHPGFTRIDTFTVTGTLVNVFPVTVLRGSTNYTYGHVLVREEGGNTIFDLRAWRTGTTFDTVTLRTVTGTGHEVDVQTIGRFIFCFARGQDPSLHYLNDTGTITATTVNPAGPGSAPVGELTTVGGLVVTISTGQTTEFRIAQRPENTDANGANLKGGKYGFAIQYISTTTGRKTQISKNVEIDLASESSSQAYAKRQIQYSVGYRANYDKALIYRTVCQGTGGSSYSGAPMHLEAIVNVPASGSFTTGYVTNADRVLVYKDVYVERGNLETTMPKGGVAQFLDGTLFISRISGAPTTPTETTPLVPPSGLGELRWSSLLETLPENFSPFGRWVPQTPTVEITGMRKVGSFLIGFAQDRIYHLRRQGAFVRIEEMHPGYGLAARYGLESVGNLIYFVSNRGLKAISAEGQVDDVLGLNSLLQNNWVATVSTVQLAYDANTMCLYTYRPTTTETGATGHAALMWFSTSRLTELIDLPFKFLRGGSWANSAGTLQRRAIFYKPQGPLSGGTQNWAAFVPATGGLETSRNKSLLGDTPILAYTSTALWPGGFDPSGATVSTANYYGCAGYLVSKEPNHISSVQLGAKVTLSSLGDIGIDGLVSCAPVYMRWTGSNIGTEFQPGAGEYKDFFRDKQVSSVGAYVEYNLSTDPVTVDSNYPDLVCNPYWMAEVYRGSRPVGPLAPNLINNQAGGAGPAIPNIRVTNASQTTSTNSRALIASCFDSTITDPEDVPNASFGKHGVVGASLSPSWVCFWPGVDLTLLALSLKGRILDTDRRYA